MCLTLQKWGGGRKRERDQKRLKRVNLPQLLKLFPVLLSWVQRLHFRLCPIGSWSVQPPLMFMTTQTVVHHSHKQVRLLQEKNLGTYFLSLNELICISNLQKVTQMQEVVEISCRKLRRGKKTLGWVKPDQKSAGEKKKMEKKKCCGSWGSRAHCQFIHSKIISSFHFSFVAGLKPFDPALGTPCR